MILRNVLCLFLGRCIHTGDSVSRRSNGNDGHRRQCSVGSIVLLPVLLHELLVVRVVYRRRRWGRRRGEDEGRGGRCVGVCCLGAIGCCSVFCGAAAASLGTGCVGLLGRRFVDGDGSYHCCFYSFLYLLSLLNFFYAKKSDEGQARGWVTANSDSIASIQVLLCLLLFLLS